MMDKNFSKKLLLERVKLNIKNNQINELEAALPVAEQGGLPKRLLERGYNLVANARLEEGNAVSSIIYFNKARQLNTSSNKILAKFVEALNLFYFQFRDEFSKEDIKQFLNSLLPIINYYKVNNPDQKKFVSDSLLLVNKLEYNSQYTATSKIETKATFLVNQIYDSLYGTMTLEEVQNEFARLITPILREKIKEEDKSSPKKDRKKKGKKKPPK
jgi:hypothetical protein